MFHIQMDLLKQLDLNKKFGLYRMDLGLFVYCIVALGIYLWPELMGYKETRTITVKTILWTNSPQVRVSSRYTSEIRKL